MIKAQQLAEKENEHETAIRYESRLNVYRFLQSKFNNYKQGNNFYDLLGYNTLFC